MAFDQSAYMREYRKANPEKFRVANQQHYRRNKERIATVKRERTLRVRYGISLAEYERMREEQGRKCAICGCDESQSPHGCLHVDHIHSTGKVRSLLCGHCNKALGLLKENPDIVYAAAVYVRKHARH